MLTLLLGTLFLSSFKSPLLEDPAISLLEIDQQIQLARLEGMSAHDELSYLLGQERQVGDDGPRLRSSHAKLRSLLKDPALKSVYQQIDDSWLRCFYADRGSFKHLRSIIDAKVLIARDLHGRDKAPSLASVSLAFQRILDLRRKYGGLEIVEGRNVVYAASEQKLNSNRGRVFGRPSSRSLLKNRADSFYFLNSSQGKTKRGTLANALNQESLTFYFEGHGNSSRLKIAGALRAKGLAKILTASLSPDSAPPILILASCKSHDFARRLFEEMDELNPETPKPILIVPEEYGQNLLKSVFTSDLLRTDLGVGITGGSTLTYALQNPRNSLSVFVPDANNLPTQIL